MDGFDHEDPNNRPEEIPLNDLNLLDDDENLDDDYEYFDAHGETSFISGGTEIIDEEERPVTSLAENLEYQRIKRDRDLQKKVNFLRSAILDVKRENWNARIDSLNNRDFLDEIEIKSDRESIWWKGKIIFKKRAGKYVLPDDKRSMKYIKEFWQQRIDINTDFEEGIESNEQSIEQLVNVNTRYKNDYLLVNIPIEIEAKPRIKGIIDNALSFNPIEAEYPETAAK